MNFKELQDNDIPYIKHLQPNGWSDIIIEFEFYVNSPFCYPIKTEINNKIIGIGAAIEFGKTAWLAHIIVDPEHRGKGIGYQIVEELLQYLKNRSINTCILIATELGLPIYEKAGFRIISEYTYLKKIQTQKNQVISDKIIPFKEEYKERIIKLDREVIGENREWLLSDFLADSSVYQENDLIKGFYLSKLREGLILADDEIAGIELLKLKFSTHNKIVLPSDNKIAIEFLKKNGYVLSASKGTRMIRGKNIYWHPQKIYSRIGGNFG